VDHIVLLTSVLKELCVDNELLREQVQAKAEAADVSADLLAVTAAVNGIKGVIGRNQEREHRSLTACLITVAKSCPFHPRQTTLCNSY